MSSPPRSPQRAAPPQPQRHLSPSRRQHLLARRLSSTRRPPSTADKFSLDAAGDKVPGTSASRKRPFPSPTKSGETRRDGLHVDHATTAIDEYEMWEEVSNVLPSLSYGEESSALLSALLDLPAGTDAYNDGPGGARCTKCNGMTAAEGVRKKAIRSGLSLSLDRLLRARMALRRRAHHVSLSQDANEEKAGATERSPPKKRKRSASEQKPEAAPNVATEILPWNVLLRVTIRMASHAAKQMNSLSADRCRCTVPDNAISAKMASKNEERLEDDERTDAATTMHALLQALDVVLAELHVLSRIQNQQPRGEAKAMDGPRPDRVESRATAPTRRGESEPMSPSQVQSPRKSKLPRDRMLRDWKSQRRCHLANEARREVWGPSRYAFLKDIESITNAFMMESTDTDVNEWHEKVNSLVAALDDSVRADLGHSPHRDEPSPPTLGLSPSLPRYAASPAKSASLASITRAHVDRVGSKIKAERQSPKRESPFATMKSYSNPDVVGVNLMSVMDKESNNDAQPSKGDCSDELEDAYRLIMAFGAPSKVESQSMRETIERRLTILVQAMADPKTSSGSLNIDGAQSYLESLLRSLMQPPNPNVWMRLLNDSRGHETTMMLRRGRALLVSFLIGLQAPGWKDVSHKLGSSPVPSYLGYLSPSEDWQSSRTKEKEQDVMNRTSYFLPAVDVGESAMPPSPIVTEVGLSLCVKNFLHGDAPRGNSTGSSGVSLFRGYGPLQYPAGSSNERENALSSIAAALPDTSELTRDLFDLTLRLAADDDGDHCDKPISLRLAMPSASESLSIVLRVVSEHIEWLSPHSIAARYRFILQHTIQSFQCFDTSSTETPTKGPGIDDKGFAPWSQRASYLIDAAKASSRGRMVLYATQFMMLLCSSRKSKGIKVPQRPTFYACLQLDQSSSFWNEVDKASDGSSSDILARVLDQSLCAGFLLPLSHHCALMLQKRLSRQGRSKGCQSTLSLVEILRSVLDVLANYGFLEDCVHVGWAVQTLLFSLSHSIFGEECPTSSLNGSDTLWEDVVRQLSRLYCDVWGKEGHKPNNQVEPTKCIKYQRIDPDTGSTTVVLMPTFKVFATSVIKYACSFRLSSDTDMNIVEGFCLFIANEWFDRYATALESYSYPGDGHALFLVSSWIGVLVTNLQEVVSFRKAARSEHHENIRRVKTEEGSAEEILTDLMTPMLKSLHLQIMQRVLRSTAYRRQPTKDVPDGISSSEFVATVFVDLYKREKEMFLTKPSPAKTRRWSGYRECLEKVFALTPPNTLLACPGNPALRQESSTVLEDIWHQYGTVDPSHSISIMVAAGLHVNRSAAYLRADALARGEDSTSAQLKRLYDAFSSAAKRCIVNTFHCFDESEAKQAHDASLTDFVDLIRSVRRDLSWHGEAGVGLAWWNEVSADLVAMLESSKEHHQNDVSKKAAADQDIAKAFSTLESRLSAISANDSK